ncbi:hypothetical protein J4Q44_G00291490 [Coregonus suidteri]|uniref:IQ domain-containing protein E-like n=1 Tax=Coregonus suidteri TaxID=861788 RepID=A0AAN8LHV1_9TELE
MSLVASDIPTDEDLEDLVEDGLSLATYISDSGKKARKKKPSGKPPPSPRSPYLSSMDVNPRRSAVSAWRPLRGTLGETLGGRGDTVGERGETARTPGENCLASLSNGHGLSQSLRGGFDITHTSARLSSSPCTPEYLQQALGIKKHKHSRSSSNDYREKEDMYDEIIHLKKSLQAQKSEKDRMKAKLRRLEEDKTKKDKQIEQLLDPTKSELKTTNLEELKITVETYFEEIQRLRMILDATEKGSRAESKGSQRQQKVLSSTVLRLSENIKQLQQENHTLREELNTDSPASGLKAYKDWSKQRLLRRLVELERRLEEVRRAPGRRSGVDRAVQTDHQTTPTETEVATPPGITTVAMEGGVAVVNTQQEGEGFVCLKGCVSQLEQDKAELQETLTNREEEVKRLIAEREQEEEEMERRQNEQRSEHEKEAQLYQLEIEQLTVKIQSLEEEKKRWTEEEEREREEQNQVNRKENPEEREEKEREERERAARVIQREWLEHREKDTVLVQSAIRGHLLRQSHLAHLRDTHTSTHSKSGQSERGSDVTSCVEGDGELDALTLIQSVFRGHLTRSALMTESSESPALPPCGPTPAPRRVPSVPTTHTHSNTAPPGSDEDVTELSEEDTWPVSNTLSNTRRLTPAQLQLHPPPDSKVAKVMDSEDSDDDIIVSPSRFVRREEIYF